MDNKYNPVNSFLETYNYVVWFENEKPSDSTKIGEKTTNLPPIPAPKGDEVKEGKELKIFTPNKLLTRLSISVAQIKARNYSEKLKTKSDKYCLNCISTIKSLKKFTTN